MMAPKGCPSAVMLHFCKSQVPCFHTTKLHEPVSMILTSVSSMWRKSFANNLGVRMLGATSKRSPPRIHVASDAPIASSASVKDNYLKKHPWSGHPAAVMRESNVYLMSYILILLEFCPPWSFVFCWWCWGCTSTP